MFQGYTGIIQSVSLSVHVSICVQNTSFCQSAGGDIKSHLVTALVFPHYVFYPIKYRNHCVEIEQSIHNKFMVLINPLPHMPILGSSNSAANKDSVSKILTNGETIF